MKARGGRRCTHLLELVFEAEEVALVLVDVQLRLGAERLDGPLARVHRFHLRLGLGVLFAGELRLQLLVLLGELRLN